MANRHHNKTKVRSVAMASRRYLDHVLSCALGIVGILLVATSSAEARRQHIPMAPLYSAGCDVMKLSCGTTPAITREASNRRVLRQNRPSRVVERRTRVKVVEQRVQKPTRIALAPAARPLPVEPVQTLTAPQRFIPGRLICAVNVGIALAERGIKGTGSALARSYLKWGRSAGGPVVGAVIVSARGQGGGGHVAIVSRVVKGVVYAWNATGGQRGWREIVYRHPVIDYRVPS